MHKDIIYRDDAIEAIHKEARLAGGSVVIQYADMFQEALLGLPSAEPEPKIGEWIFVHPLQKDDSGAYMCSCCENGDWDIKLTDKFCKFCGARMIYDGNKDETN